MSRFTRQEAISALNKALPPSSAQVHNPGNVLDSVQLVHEFFASSWGCDQLKTVSFTSAVAATQISGGTVPKGKYWYVHSAHGVSLASSVGKMYSLALEDTISALDSVIAGPFNNSLTISGIAAYVGVTCYAPRPFIIPPLHKLNHNSSAADAAAQLMLRFCFVELDVGTPPPIRF